MMEMLNTLNWPRNSRTWFNYSTSSEWRHDDVVGNQLVYTKRTSAHSIYSRVRLHVSIRG